MTEHVLHLRSIGNNDWATLLFVLSFGTIAFTKSIFENRFGDFANLIFSDKYIKIYRDSSHLKSGFTISLFFVQVISFAFFIQLSLSYFGKALKTDWILYIQIITFLIFFILSKYLIEKIIATAFDIEEFAEQFNLQKVTYRTYIGLFITASVISYLISIKNYQNLILGKLFYFILYLCTLEIAPYYFMYYWFTKGSA